ncbi:hypothetical protein I3U51_12690 [Mycobacteroides abscessus subsp. abscessus]|uniref:hypothetical protein n=1 Tax=Mycobacteroides abscessus TaxID=36809 RepID=UPI0009C9B43D|nr:hypothetical protein [Mycobacteroides abscessus]MBN7441384.1 hypothetical protein [Mycobacteroides abscessus subsp. abscessus]SLH66969.1 Uncharacterised protein [Mycobacteroides abscessus subsp. abscessus]
MSPQLSRNAPLQGIGIVSRQLRSANVEHDTAAAALDGYVVTNRGLALLQRIAATFDDPDSARAWAVTGPYGAGKSSFAVMLAALLCPTPPARSARRSRSGADQMHNAALTAVARRDQDLAEAFREHAARAPMLRAAVTARREPVTSTVMRALEGASAQDQELAEDLRSLPSDGAIDGALLDVIRRAAARRPLLIVIDEFGKSLEHFADDPSGGDLFFLQELAELASGHRADPVYLLTFQHAPFTEYSTGIASLQGREWRKIQGRFHDVTYSDDVADVAAVVRGTLTQDLDSDANAALRRYAKAATTRWAALGLDSLLLGTSELFAQTYPVHPLVLAGLPELCARLGQHGRTLAGFLTGDEPHTVARFLHSSPGSTDANSLPVIKLDSVYDYFADSVASSTAAAGARWLEITARVESARHLDDFDEMDLQLLKAAGLLNLVSAGGVLRASLPTLTFALNDPQQNTAANRRTIARRIEHLQDRGYLTYREHDDEYRLWDGTDVDIAARVAAIREQLTGVDIAGLLNRSYLPSAIVAGRHSQITGMLRYFQPVAVDAASTAINSSESATRPDGFLIMNLTAEAIGLPSSETPILIGTTPDVAAIRRAATETLALGELLDATDLDAVARAEIRERLTSSQSSLANVMARAFDPARHDVVWRLRVEDASADKAIGIHPSMSALVSAACDIAYCSSPEIRSEMLGRNQLTSQGAKARRELLTALLERPGAPCGGLSGHGPEVAMYRGVVEHLHLHGPITAGPEATYGWTKPKPKDSAEPVYRALVDSIRSHPDGVSVADLEALAVRPPFGVKAGVFPILLAALLAIDVDIAIFEDGTFQTSLQPELLERAIKGPERIRLKYSPIGSGQAAEVIGKLSQALGLAGRTGRTSRSPGLVLVAATLLQNVSAISEFARNTRRLSEHAMAARSALLAARDPERLIFHELPAALNHRHIESDSDVDAKSAARLVAEITKTMDELRTADAALEQSIAEQLGAALSPPAVGIPAIRRTLARQARLISVAPTDMTLRAFLQHAQQETLDDPDWIAQAAMIIEAKPPMHWRDDNVDSFAAGARHLVRAIGRLYALHLDAPGEHGTAQRLTLTGADGQEEHLVLDGPAHPEAELALDKALASARTVLGPDAERQLLSILAARTLRKTNVGALHD